MESIYKMKTISYTTGRNNTTHLVYTHSFDMKQMRLGEIKQHSHGL